MSNDEKIVRLSRYKQKKMEMKTFTPAHLIKPDSPSTNIDEICSEAIAAMLVELEKNGIDTEHAKVVTRLRIINRFMLETVDEVVNRKTMSSWMKNLLNF